MANLIGKELGVKVEIIPVTSANRIPYLQTKKADLVISSLGKNPEREKVIDFSVAYAPFFSGVYGIKDRRDRRRWKISPARPSAPRAARSKSRKSPRWRRSTATIKRYEDNNATISAFISGQVDLIATGNVIAAAIAEKSHRRAPPVVKFVIKDLPCYVGLNKDEPKLLAKVNEIIAKAKSSGELGEDFGEMAESSRSRRR